MTMRGAKGGDVGDAGEGVEDAGEGGDDADAAALMLFSEYRAHDSDG